ncbi:MAG TPA: SirB2 family protein [Hydrogenophaga sp.]
MSAADLIASTYPVARQAHLGLVGLSVGLFMVRGLGVLLGGAWPMRPLFKRASMAIDTALLAAGATLWALLQLNPLHDTWLGVKLILLVVYIVLGTFALRRGANVRKKALFFLAALACVAFMASIAIHHNPLGWWA